MEVCLYSNRFEEPLFNGDVGRSFSKDIPSLGSYQVPSPNESPLHAVHSHGSDEDDLKKTKQTYSSAFTKLILRIKKLESKVKTGKAIKARVVLSKDYCQRNDSTAGRVVYEEGVKRQGRIKQAIMTESET
ncbi:hypothetical protein Tco_0598018 [Tanacetum coccineum]